MNNQRKKRTTITKEIITLIDNHISSGKSNKMISDALNISISRKIGNRLLSEEKDSIVIKKKGRKSSPENILTSQLTGIISNNNALTQRGMIEQLADFGIQRTQSSISKILSKAEITRKRLVKVPESRNSPRVIDLRQQYAQELQHFSTSQLVYLDETGFNLHTTQNYGYSMKNTKAYITVPANRGKNISLMAAISLNGIIGYTLTDGAYNGEIFKDYILIYLISYLRNNLHSLLVMDNCRFHHRSDVLQLLNENRIPFKFLPPYTPDLNPIENFFSEIKAIFRAITPSPSSREELKERVGKILNAHDGNFVEIFEHAKSLLPKALPRQQFI